MNETFIKHLVTMRKSCGNVYLACMAIVMMLLRQNDGQRLSQGASDWYMRFHSNFRHVKREVDPPEIKSFVVSSTINVSLKANILCTIDFFQIRINARSNRNISYYFCSIVIRSLRSKQ